MNSLLLLLFLCLISGFGAAHATILIHTDNPGDSASVAQILKVADELVVNLIGSYPDEDLDVYVVGSNEKFQELSGRSVPDWGAAVAIPYKNRIVVKSPRIMVSDKSLRELVIHEYSHIALARAVLHRRVPRWIDEGMAMYLSAEWGWEDNAAISWAAAVGNTIPLPEIEMLNRFKGSQVYVAYSESYLAFSYFLETYHVSSLSLLLDSFRRGYSYDESFRQAIGADYDEFNREFTIYLHGRYNFMTLIFDSNFIWIILAFIFILGLLLNRMRRRRRMDELEEYNQLHSTDFDYGDEIEEPDEDKPWD